MMPRTDPTVMADELERLRQLYLDRLTVPAVPEGVLRGGYSESDPQPAENLSLRHPYADFDADNPPMSHHYDASQPAGPVPLAEEFRPRRLLRPEDLRTPLPPRRPRRFP